MRRISVVLAVLVALLMGVSNASAHPQDGKYRATYYSGSRGACGGALVGHYIATNWYKCGARLRITWHGTTTTGYVADRMGAWPNRGCRCVDLAPALFHTLHIPLWKGVAQVQVESTHRG